jgi:hypothetical protein
MKVWITKYALTSGIIEANAEQSENAADCLVLNYDRNGKSTIETVLISDCCVTRTEAVTLAEQMRQKKLASLEKQLERLKKLKFE